MQMTNFYFEEHFYQENQPGAVIINHKFVSHAITFLCVVSIALKSDSLCSVLILQPDVNFLKT